MEIVKSGQRERFEEDTFAHLEALWRTALRLTVRTSLAEDLVLKTIAEAYRTWHVSGDTVGSKARLFRILAREFSNNGYRSHQPDRFLPENCSSAGNTDDRGRHSLGASFSHQELVVLSSVPEASVIGAIAHLRPQSRLVLILLMCEQFSYADIAYVADLRENAVRSILSRLRRLIPRYLVRNANPIVTAVDNRAAFNGRGASSDRDMKPGRYALSNTAPRDCNAKHDTDNWENEGGALDGNRTG